MSVAFHRTVCALLFWLAAGCGLAAQMVVNEPPRSSFEVATVKPSAPGSMASEGQWSPPGIGRFWAKSVSLEFLIGMAYGVDAKQIEGKPGWLGSALFDIAAKPEAEVALSRDELRPRLENLLEQRFHLATHRETRMVPGYELVVARGGPKLRATEGGHWPGFRVNVSPGHLVGFNWSMAFLATTLGGPAGRPVVDRTGIGGSYDIEVEYAPDVAKESTLPPLLTALQETLGLKLEPRKVPVEVLVIDHAERVPVEN